jgi:hypothetical protein
MNNARSMHRFQPESSLPNDIDDFCSAQRRLGLLPSQVNSIEPLENEALPAFAIATVSKILHDVRTLDARNKPGLAIEALDDKRIVNTMIRALDRDSPSGLALDTSKDFAKCSATHARLERVAVVDQRCAVG